MASLKHLGRTIKSILTDGWGTRFHNIDCAEEMIFPGEKFLMPDCLDVDGNLHHFFEGYEADIPPFYVRSLKNGMCYMSCEEVYTSKGQVVLDHYTQKETPPVRWRRFIKNNVTYVNGKVMQLCLTGLERNYYHWLVECLGRLYLIKKSNFRPDFYIADQSLPFQKQWLTLLGIKEEQIIEPNLFIQAEELIVPDLINNWYPVEFRKHPICLKRWLPHWIIDLYKETVIPNIPRQPKKNIYVRRQNALHRKLVNENELLPILDEHDFVVVNSENLTVEKQLEIFSNAQAIVGLHGAGLANAAFSDEGTPVLELNTQYYHESSFRILFSQTGQRYHYMIGETHDVSVSPLYEDVYINPEKFASALNMIMSVKTQGSERNFGGLGFDT